MMLWWVPSLHLFFPQRKDESWWIVVGQPDKNHLSAIKKIPLQQRTKVKLSFEPSKLGQQDYKLYLMCDSYMGCDQEYVFSLQVRRGENYDEDLAPAEAEEAALQQQQRESGDKEGRDAGGETAQPNGKDEKMEESSDEDEDEEGGDNKAKKPKKE